MGYTQEDVAWLLGHKSVSRISKWEKGVSMPNIKNLLKLSYLYRTLADQLYFDLSRELRIELHEKEKKIPIEDRFMGSSP